MDERRLRVSEKEEDASIQSRAVRARSELYRELRDLSSDTFVSFQLGFKKGHPFAAGICFRHYYLSGRKSIYHVISQQKEERRRGVFLLIQCRVYILREEEEEEEEREWKCVVLCCVLRCACRVCCGYIFVKSTSRATKQRVLLGKEQPWHAEEKTERDRK